jgi:hypothetical protein
MRLNHGILIASLVFLYTFSAEAQVNVSRVTDPAAFEAKEGTFYYLPGTYLQLEVCYDRVEKVRGPYADYAYKFLGLDSVIKVNEHYYELKEIRCNVHTGPDPQQLYFVEFLQKQSKDPLALHLILSEQGFLTEAAMGMDIPVQSFGEQPAKVREEISCRTIEQDRLFRYYATNNQVLKIDTIIKMVTIDTSTFKDVSFKRSMIYKTMEERAGEAADFVTAIREDRLKLLTGYQEVNYDQGTMEYMDANLMEMEDSYLSLFKGICRHESYKAYLTYFPSSEKAGQDELICRFSASEGMKQATDQQGDPVFIRIGLLGNINPSHTQDSGSQPVAGQGFVFRMPQLCQVSVTHQGKEIITKEILIHQLGIQSHYPATSKFHIQLHPSGGSVRQVSVR